VEVSSLESQLERTNSQVAELVVGDVEPDELRHAGEQVLDTGQGGEVTELSLRKTSHGGGAEVEGDEAGEGGETACLHTERSRGLGGDCETEKGGETREDSGGERVEDTALEGEVPEERGGRRQQWGGSRGPAGCR
jgi:hypothetical protein